MSASIERRMVKLELTHRERLHPPLVALVRAGETENEAVARAMAAWAPGFQEFSMVVVINIHGGQAVARRQ